MERRNTTSIGFNYTLQTKEVQIPYMENYLQKALFILSPKDDYAPNIDANENSKALRNNQKETVEWSREEFKDTKSILLKINSTYIVILRMYGRLIEQSANPNVTKQYATIDCVQKFDNSHRLLTQSWPCTSGDPSHILAHQICDMKSDCSDSSDEASWLCKGSQIPFQEHMNYFLHSTLIMGFMSYSFTFILTSLSCLKLNEEVVCENEELSEHRRKCYKTMRKACANINMVNEKNAMIKEEDVEELKTVYKESHESGSSYQTVFYEAVEDFSIDPNLEDSCSVVIDSVIIDEADMHNNDIERTACLDKSLRNNLGNAGYVLNVIDRHSFFTRVFLAIISVPKYIFGESFPAVTFYITVTYTVLMAIKSIIVTYADLSMDANIFAALRHIVNHFIVDEDKFQQVARLPLESMSYLYIISGILSQLSFVVIYAVDFKILYNFKNQWVQKLVLILSVLYPTHFVAMEMAKAFVSYLKTINDFRKGLKESLQEDANVRIKAEEYLDYRKNLNKYMGRLLLFRSSIIKMLMMEFLLENIPQISVSITFVISELNSRNGRLLTVIGNSIMKYLGGDIPRLCILMILILSNKLTSGLLLLRNRNQFPLGNGMKGTIFQIFLNILMMGSKLALLATLFSNSLFMYPAIVFLEMGVAVMYFKCLNIKLDAFQTIVPCLISTSLLTIQNDDFKLRMTRKKMETLSSVIIGCLNLVVIYGPMFLAIEFVDYFKEYRSQFSINIHIAAVICFALVTIFHPVLLHGVFETFASPWRFLRELPSDQKNKYDTISKSTHKNKFVPEGEVDPTDIQPFMPRALDEAKEKRTKRK